MALILVGTAVLLFFARGRVPKQRWWVRLLAAAACIGFGACSWVWWYSDNGLYDRQENASLFNVWKDTENYASHGFLYSFLHSVSTAIMPAPEGYSKEAAQILLSDFSDQAIPADRRVNVVVTMLESFSDLSELESIDFTADAQLARQIIEKPDIVISGHPSDFHATVSQLGKLAEKTNMPTRHQRSMRSGMK